MTDSLKKIEEQTLSHYHRKKFYPVRIGQVFNDRYRVIAKLGYGAYSTVCLHGIKGSSEYTTLKVSVRVDSNSSHILNEIKMLHRLRDFEEREVEHKERHPGLLWIRLANDIFEIESQSGQHYCMTFKPQGYSVQTLQETIYTMQMPRVVHTDISPANILMELPNDSTLQDVESRASATEQSPIYSGDDIIYKSFPTKSVLSSQPILTDFGTMEVVKEGGNEGWCMSDAYRAPEVLLGLPWGPPIDVWSIGVMTLELLEGRNLFYPIDPADNKYVIPLALAQYIGYLGPPPFEIVRHSPHFHKYFDEQGNWALSAQLEIPKTSLEDFVTTIPPGEEKDKFLRFIRKMLTWNPKTRAKPEELGGADEWLLTEIPWEI